MALFVLDASVSISWCFPGDPTENTPYSRHDLAAYDVAYLHLAQRKNLPLATSDGPLRDAALAEGVALI